MDAAQNQKEKTYTILLKIVERHLDEKRKDRNREAGDHDRWGNPSVAISVPT